MAENTQSLSYKEHKLKANFYKNLKTHLQACFGAVRLISIFVPRVGAFSAFIEYGCRLVARPDLNCHVVGPLVLAVDVRIRILTLDKLFVHVCPRVFSSQHIFHFLPLQMHLGLELLLHFENVGTRPAEEAEVLHRFFAQKNI